MIVLIKIKKYKYHRQGIGAATAALVVALVVISLGFKPQEVHSLPSAYTENSSAAASPSGDKQTAADAKATSKATAPKAVTPAVVAPAVKTAVPVPAAAAAPSVSKSLSLYLDPSANAAVQARAWAASNPADAAKMNRLASVPVAQWFGDWSGNVQTAANSYVGRAAAAGQVPVLVAYNIPQRDCGSYSAGGAASAGAYKAWIAAMAAGIGQRQAIVIVEPDALPLMDCLSSADQQSRLDLLSYAVQTLRAQTKAAIYLDAGNSNWQPASVMASRLTSAGVASATGFSLNVSNFNTTVSNVAFGTDLSGRLGGKHFVIDTSRNGNGPASGDLAWCNPDGRALGNAPTLQTGNALADAYLWVKTPGESDGTCGASQQGTNPPAAGAWWPQYALMLATNSGW